MILGTFWMLSGWLFGICFGRRQDLERRGFGYTFGVSFFVQH